MSKPATNKIYELSSYLVLFLLCFMPLRGLPQDAFAQEAPTVKSVRSLPFIPIRGSKRLALAEDSLGAQWIRGSISPDLLGKTVILHIPSSHVREYQLYLLRNNKLIAVPRNANLYQQHVKSRYPQYRFIADTSMYYIHLTRAMHQHAGTMQVLIQTLDAFASYENGKLLGMGVYYGLALMSLVFNVVFYLAFRDKRFITYCALLFTTFLSSFYEDGLFYYFSDGRWSPDFLIVWSFCATAIFSMPFTYYFLGLESVLRPYRKWYWVATSLLIGGALTYTFTGIMAIYHSLTACCLFLAFFCVFLAIRRFRKDVYARFLVFAFSLVLLTAILYVMYLYVNPSAYEFFDIGTFRMVSGMEIIIISFAIIFKVKALQEVNERYRAELNKYLHLLESEYIIQFGKTEQGRGSQNDSYYSPTKTELTEELKLRHALTDREIEVLLCIWEGLTNNEIAQKLFISLSTVKYHVSNLYIKLDVKNRNQVLVLQGSLITAS